MSVFFLVPMSALLRISLLSLFYICLPAGVMMAALFRISLPSILYIFLPAGVMMVALFQISLLSIPFAHLQGDFLKRGTFFFKKITSCQRSKILWSSSERRVKIRQTIITWIFNGSQKASSAWHKETMQEMKIKSQRTNTCAPRTHSLALMLHFPFCFPTPRTNPAWTYSSRTYTF